MVWCRPGTTDIVTFTDTFASGFHRPPPGIAVERILDLGCNIGTTIVDLATRHPEAKIIGVELDEQNAGLAKLNSASYAERVRILHAAVWPERRRLTYTGNSEDAYRVNATEEGEPDGSVQGLPLQDICALFGSETTDFVKMDIEGAEASCLRRGGGWSELVRCIKVEVHPPYTVEECAQDLKRLGFAASVVTDHPRCVLGQRVSG